MAATLLTDTKITSEIAKAKAGSGRRTLRDNEVRGLVLRITPNGTATWSLHYRAKGATGACRLTLDRYPALGLGDARDLAEVKLGIGRGRVPKWPKGKLEEGHQLEEFFIAA